jgi:hypothetical protein
MSREIIAPKDFGRSSPAFLERSQTKRLCQLVKAAQEEATVPYKDK